MAASLLRQRAASFAFDRSIVRPRKARALAHAMASSSAPNYFILQYKYVPDILEKRDPYRQGHLDAIKDAIAAKKIVIAGAIAEPVDGGLLIFEGCSKDEVEEYAKTDPYSKGGLIADYTIRPYIRVQ